MILNQVKIRHPRRVFDNIWRHFLLLHLCVYVDRVPSDMCWAEARDAAKKILQYTEQPPQQRIITSAGVQKSLMLKLRNPFLCFE